MQTRWARFPVPLLGVRYPALGANPVLGPGSQVPGTRFGVRPWVLGPRPGRRMGGKSYLPCPSSFHGRGPDTEHREPSRKARYPAPEPVRRRGPNTEHRRPSLATGKRAHRRCILDPASI